MPRHTLTVDFNNADESGRLRLNLVGTLSDIARLGIGLENGLSVIVHDEELEADGEVVYSEDERIWVAKTDWDAIRRVAHSA